MKIIRIPAGIYQTNCYLAFDPDTKEGFLVDPAGEPELLHQHIEEQEAVIKAILLTHGHGDHIGAVAEMREAFDVPVYAHEDEKALLEDPVQNQSKSMFHGPCTVEADVFVTDGEVIPVSGGVQVIHTPGHTAGGVCYLVSGNVFSGDTLFLRSIGRTDLQTAIPEQMQESLEKLKQLPPETIVYPGHGPQTNIENELRYNSFLQ